jgi:hypothetical protein
MFSVAMAINKFKKPINKAATLHARPTYELNVDSNVSWNKNCKEMSREELEDEVQRLRLVTRRMQKKLVMLRLHEWEHKNNLDEVLLTQR